MKRRVYWLSGLVVPFGGFSAVAAEPAGAVILGDLMGLVDLQLLVSIGLGAALIAALISLYRVRRALGLRRDILKAVAQPRQVVGPKGETIYANRAFRDFFGRIDKPLPELLAQEAVGDSGALDQLERLAADARKGTAGHLDLRVRARSRERDGHKGDSAGIAGDRVAEDRVGEEQVEWRYVAAYPMPGHPGTVLWRVDDITLRRQMDQVISEEQEHFVDLLEHAPIGFYSVDAKGYFLFVNQTLCEWLGRSRKDLEGGKVSLHDILADPLPAETPGYHPFAAEGQRDGEVTLNGADGDRIQTSISQHPVYDKAGTVLRARSVVRHLSRERAVVDALEHSVRRFERFFLEAPVGIALLDSAGGITECNRAFAALIGRQAAQLKRAVLRDLVQIDERTAVEAALKRSVQGDLAPAQAPVEVHFSRGEETTVCALYITSLVGTKGAAPGFIAHLIDTTEQKNLEIQFSQSQKMQAVGQLAGGIAHDFNNLLTAMIGFSDLLLSRHRAGDQSFADIMQIKQNANRAANLVRQLLAFSRQQPLQPQRLDVTDILAELSHLLRRLIGENIELEMVHGRDLGTVRADQGQLDQVIINLAVNARDAMPEGGTLSIRTSNATIEQDTKINNEIMPPGQYVLIEVADTGSGIAPAVLDRIFEPFFSTKEVGAGTGLGLSTVYGIIKQSNGYVAVDSALGRGTVFRIFLPEHGEAAGAEASELEAAGVPTLADKAEMAIGRDLTGAGTVLLVEDEEAVRAFSARVLRAKGYQVLEASSGESALEVLRDSSSAIDLLVTDVVMPRVDGPTLVQEVRERWPAIKVIFISGYTEDSFRQRLGEGTEIHFLPKPFSLKQLAGKVKDVMDRPRAIPAPGADTPASAATAPGTTPSATAN